MSKDTREGILSILFVIGTITAIVALVLLFMGHIYATTHYTARVDKLLQENTASSINDYIRVTMPDGKKVIWNAYPEIWGLLEEGTTCQFEVRDESKRVVKVDCQEGNR